MVGRVQPQGYMWSGGIGYISVPSDIDREKYIQDCYINSRVSIKCEDGSFFNRVPITTHVLDDIEFPQTSDQLGSCVVYIAEQLYQYPIIIGKLNKTDNISNIKQNSFNINRICNDKVVNINGDANSGVINLTISAGGKKGIFNIDVDNDNDDCLMNINISGDVEVSSTKDIKLVSQTQFVSEIHKTQDEQEQSKILQQLQQILIKNRNITFNGENIEIKQLNGLNLIINKDGIILDSNDKPITIVSGNNKVHITSNNVEINSDSISLGGSFEVLYNLIPNAPITDVSQIGVSKKVKIG